MKGQSIFTIGIEMVYFLMTVNIPLRRLRQDLLHPLNNIFVCANAPVLHTSVFTLNLVYLSISFMAINVMNALGKLGAFALAPAFIHPTALASSPRACACLNHLLCRIHLYF